MNIRTATVANLAEWQSVATPASEAAIQQLLASVGLPLPVEFLELLRVSNGGEGSLAISPWWFQLWSTTEIPQHNAGYETEKWFPGYLGFGSSGGGEMFAFRQGASCAVFAIPFCNADLNDISLVANNLLAFVQAMGVKRQPTAV